MGITRKQPRDFVYIDELWEANSDWPSFFIDQKVWVLYDEYQAQLPGDQDYCRIVIQYDEDCGWILRKPIFEKESIEIAVQSITQPVSQKQLLALGFIRWYGRYDLELDYQQ